MKLLKFRDCSTFNPFATFSAVDDGMAQQFVQRPGLGGVQGKVLLFVTQPNLASRRFNPRSPNGYEASPALRGCG